MARPPEVFVRPVTMTEGRRLQRIGRTANDPVKLRRAIVVLMSAQGQSAPEDHQVTARCAGTGLRSPGPTAGP
jgi:hypothetical protein